MISMHHGQRLVNALNKVGKNPTGIKGKYVPMTCSMSDVDDKNYCLPVTVEDEIYVNRFLKELYGTISVLHGSDDHTFKYIQAEFGSRIENEETFDIIDGGQYDNDNFCNEIVHGNVDFTNKAVMVPRGSCNFAVKAQNIALMGAKMMILVNDDDNDFSMGVESDYLGSTIHLAAVMISESSGREISTLLNNSDGNHVLKLTFYPSSTLSTYV